MSKCIVSTLAGSANDDSLSLFGAIELKYTGSSLAAEGLAFSSADAGNPSVVKSLEEGEIEFLNNSGTSVTYTTPFSLPTSNTILNLSSPKKFYVDNKYGLSRININGYSGYVLDDNSKSLDTFKYCSSLITFDVVGQQGLYGNVNSTFENSKATIRHIIIVGNRNVVCSLGELADFTTLRKLGLTSCSVSGNISSLVNLVELTELSLGDTNAEGISETLIQAIYTNKTVKSGTFTFTINEKIKFKQTSGTQKRLICTFSDSGITVNVSSSLVASYDGTNWKDQNGVVYDPTA